MPALFLTILYIFQEYNEKQALLFTVSGADNMISSKQ